MKIRRYDVLAIILSLAVFLGFTLYGMKFREETGYLLVEDAESQYLYPLSEDRTITMTGPVGETVIEIHDGEAHFLSSDCPDGLCVQMAPIAEAGDWAACLPNQVFITTSGGASKGVDAGVY